MLLWLMELRGLRIAVIIVAHANARGLLRGATGKEDNSFCTLQLEPLGTEMGREAKFKSHFTKARGFNPPDLEWSFLTDEKTGLYKVEHCVSNPGEEVLALIRQGA